MRKTSKEKTKLPDRERLLTILRSGLLFETEEVLKMNTPCTQIHDGGFEVQFKGKTYVIVVEEAKWRTMNPRHT